MIIQKGICDMKQLSLEKRIQLLEQQSTLTDQEATLLSHLKRTFKHRQRTHHLNRLIREKEERFFFSKEERLWFYVLTGMTVKEFKAKYPPIDKIITWDCGYRLIHNKTYVAICKILSKQWKHIEPKTEEKTTTKIS